MKPYGAEFTAWYSQAKLVGYANRETECGKLLIEAASELAWREVIASGYKLEIAELKAALAAKEKS